MKISFQNYCEDIIDLQAGLMSEQQKAEALISYKAFTTPARTQTQKSPLENMKASDLRAKLERLIESQRYSVSKYAEQYDVSLSIEIVDLAEKALAGKITKKQMIDLIDMNSEASRQLNNQLKAEKTK